MNDIITGPSWFELVSFILNMVLGGTLIVTIATLRSAKKEAEANAKKAEADAKNAEETVEGSKIQNADSAIKIWKDLAVEMSNRQDKLSKQVEELSIEVKRLKTATNRVIRLLDRITPENLEDMVKKIKDEIENQQTDIRADIANCAIRLSDSETVDSGSG